MKLSLDIPTGGNVITHYDANGITINQVLHTGSLVVSARRLIDDWGPMEPSQIHAGHWQVVIDMAPEVVLLGTGNRLHFPAQSQLAELMKRGIGVEVMDTMAACRTYNILLGEERKVVAALLPLQTPLQGSSDLNPRVHRGA
jgi:uncharacterized protein